MAEGTSILEAARKADVKIPQLCYNPDLTAWAACGICVVKIEGSAKMLRACSTPITEGMSVITHDPDIVQTRRTVIEMILSTHPNDCLTCPRNQSCELQELGKKLGVRGTPLLIFSDGRRVSGALPAQEIERRLGATSARK